MTALLGQSDASVNQSINQSISRSIRSQYRIQNSGFLLREWVGQEASQSITHIVVAPGQLVSCGLLLVWSILAPFCLPVLLLHLQLFSLRVAPPLPIWLLLVSFVPARWYLAALRSPGSYTAHAVDALFGGVKDLLGS
jgi:hypothetical protein